MPDYAYNRKASFEYDILEKFEAGLVLTGPEVKSIRGSGLSLNGVFVTFHNQEGWLVNLHIPRCKYASSSVAHEPDRSRKLLLNKKEISYLTGKLAVKGLTIIPLRLYNKARHLKVEIALVRGKKKHDKREKIKRRDLDRQIQRAKKGELN